MHESAVGTSVNTNLPSLPSASRSTFVVAGLDVLCVCASLTGASFLRHGGVHLPFSPNALPLLLAFLVLLKGGIFWYFRLYQGLWGHAGTPEAVRLVKASTLASSVLLVGFLVVPGAPAPPLALLILDWMLTTATTGGHRFGRRVLGRPLAPDEPGDDRILIYGADAYAMLVFRYLRHTASGSVVGFVAPNQQGLRLQGRPIVGGPGEVDADEVVFPVLPPPADHARTREVSQIADEFAEHGISCSQFELKMRSSSSTTPPKNGDQASATASSSKEALSRR